MFHAGGKASTRRHDTHTNRDGFHEAKRLSQGHRYWRRGRRNAGGAGDRAVDAGDQMAPDDELAEIARHAVGRRRGDGQGRRRSHRQQIPDPDLCRRRNRSGPAGARCRAERHRRDGPYGVLLLFRQGSDLYVRHGGAVRTQPAPQPGLVHAGRRQGAAERVLQELQRHVVSGRQHRLPDGRLVPQGDQHRRRPEGAEDSASAALPGA